MVSQPFSRMVIAPNDPEEIIKIAISRAKKRNLGLKGDKLVKVKTTSLAYLSTLYNYTIIRLRRICLSVPRIDNLHPFYRELTSLLIDINRFKKALAKLYSASKVLEGILDEERDKLRKARNIREVKLVKKEALGRYFSVMDSLKEDLKVIRGYQLTLGRLQAIDPEVKTIVIAGPPNVGKSSLVRVLSRAKPEVREYPFTTKSLTVGHIEMDDGSKVQIVDTPGLLDRPLSSRNKIELQAVLALRYLARVIIFLIDPSETCGYPLERQLKVLREVEESFKGVPIIKALNKVDITPKEKIEEVTRILQDKVYRISALRKINVDVLLQEVLGYLLKNH
ncbi:MAG: GTPase [Thermofilum sp. ex4484_15]|nr:MAG: GTPase [Thermofilum sp. ex4484_15]